MTATSMPRVAVLGLGNQGSAIARLLQEHGAVLVGAIDVGDRAGKPLREYVSHPATPDDAVFDSLDALIAGAGKPDILVFAANVPTAVGADMKAAILGHGINVLTLNEELFEGEGPEAEKLDAIARANGVSLIATGFQDNLWLHLPAQAAATVCRLKRVVFDDFSDTSVFSAGTGEMLVGMGLDADAFQAWHDEAIQEPPVQGGTMRELARLLGFTPVNTRYQILPIFAETPTWWAAAETTVPVGKVIGARYLVESDTVEGVAFEGNLTFKIADEGQVSQNVIVLEGDNSIRLTLTNDNHQALTQMGIIRRLHEVIDAPAGIVRAAHMTPPRYTHPTA